MPPTDFGIYSAVACGPEVVCCLMGGETVLTRATP